MIVATRGSSSAPVLVVSDRIDKVDRRENGGSVEALDVGRWTLDVGADDYVIKPISAHALLEQIRALSHQTPAVGDDPVVHFGDVTVERAV